MGRLVAFSRKILERGRRRRVLPWQTGRQVSFPECTYDGIWDIDKWRRAFTQSQWDPVLLPSDVRNHFADCAFCQHEIERLAGSGCPKSFLNRLHHRRIG